MKDLAKYGSYLTGSILFIAIIRLSILGNRFGLPLGNFINFQNLISYSLGVVHPFTWFAIVSSFGFVCYKAIFKVKPAYEFRTGIVFLVLFLISAGITLYYYCHIDGTVWSERTLFGLGYICLASLYLCQKYLLEKLDNQLILTTLIFCFLFFFAKVEVREEIFRITCKKINKGSSVVFNYNNTNTYNRADTIIVSTPEKYFVTSTLDFVFFYDERDHKTTAYPLKDVKYISFIHETSQEDSSLCH
jgi:hypothetical protein